ncbi:glycine cleavage system protein GcvH [candidate division KSB1 bacterium]
MNIPSNLHYAETHEWIRIEGDLVVIGITDYAQNEFGEVGIIDLPDVGAEFDAKEPFGIIENNKAENDVYAPVSGEIVEVNTKLTEGSGLELINSDPYGEGWMVKIKMNEKSELDNLLSSEDYTKLISE